MTNLTAESKPSIRLAALVDENVEAISLARACDDGGHTKEEVLAAINRKVDDGLCVVLGQSDTHIIVAWNEEQPFVITVNDYEKYVDASVIADAPKAEARE